MAVVEKHKIDALREQIQEYINALGKKPDELHLSPKQVSLLKHHGYRDHYLGMKIVEHHDRPVGHSSQKTQY